ncbi:MAG: hypothetical protein ACYDEQ_13120 [Desulfocucumaceae bacterium]
MITYSGEEFTGEVRKVWMGKAVEVSKTVPTRPIALRIESAKMAEWEDMDRRIKDKHHRDTKFLTFSGPVLAEAGEENTDKVTLLVIPVGGGTVYDMREGRLVVLTDSEVVQLSLREH